MRASFGLLFVDGCEPGDVRGDCHGLDPVHPAYVDIDRAEAPRCLDILEHSLKCMI